MTEQKKQPNERAQGGQNAAGGADTGLNRGVPSLVAMDNPDDSQLGADRTQSRDSGR